MGWDGTERHGNGWEREEKKRKRGRVEMREVMGTEGMGMGMGTGSGDGYRIGGYEGGRTRGREEREERNG